MYILINKKSVSNLYVKAIKSHSHMILIIVRYTYLGSNKSTHSSSIVKRDLRDIRWRASGLRFRLYAFDIPVSVHDFRERVRLYFPHDGRKGRQSPRCVLLAKIRETVVRARATLQYGLGDVPGIDAAVHLFRSHVRLQKQVEIGRRDEQCFAYYAAKYHGGWPTRD